MWLRKGEIMDKGANRIAQDIKDITQTRMAIAEKLGAIEQHVGATMKHGRMIITQVAENTTSSVRETMKATREACDLSVQASRHPWGFVVGSLLLGYAFGTLYRRGWQITNGVVPYYPPGTNGAAVMPGNGSPSSEQEEPGVYPYYPHRATNNARREQGQADRFTVWGELEGALQAELGVIQSGLIRFGRGLLRELVRQAFPTLVQIIYGYRGRRNLHSESK
jgi:hypothetical protein